MSSKQFPLCGSGLFLRPALILCLSLAVVLLTATRGYAEERGISSNVPQPLSAAEPQQSDGDYVQITDKSGVLSVEVPATWTEMEETEWVMDDEPVGTKLTVAPNLEDFASDWGVPGLVLSYSKSLPAEMTVEELLDVVDYSDTCEEGDRDDLPDGELIGMYQIWGSCDDSATTAAIVALVPADSPDYYVLMEIYAVTEDDLDAMEQIIATLLVGNDSQSEEAVVSTDSALLDSVDTSDLTYTYVELRDPAVVALIPAEYGEVEDTVWESSEGDPLGYRITAAPSIQDFNDTWTTAGMIVKSTIDMVELLDPDEMLTDDALTENCTYDDRYTDEREIEGVTYLVDYDWYDNCYDSENDYVVGLAQSDPADVAIFFDFLIAEPADEEAFDVFLQSFSIDRELAATPYPGVDTGTSTDEPSADELPATVFVDVSDDSGTISLRVPEAWSDTRSEDWDLGDGPIGVSFYAAPDVDLYIESWEVPGTFIGVSEEVAESLSPTEALDVLEFNDSCTYDQRYDYETANLEGAYDVWDECGEVEGAVFVVLAATPTGEESPLVLLQVAMLTAEDAAAFGEITNSLAIAGAVTSVEASEEEELLDEALAMVQVDSLNIRNGPGTNYNRVGLARQGDALIINGQLDNCDWLQITTADGIEGWTSGKEQYVTLDTRCADLPEAKRPAAPPASTAAGEETGARTGQNEGQSSTAGGQTGSQSGNSNQGCYLFQNQLGSEVTITLTRTDTGRGTTFKVAGGGESEQCFDPGRYTYTMDAPPPWNSINGELTVEAGDAFLWPIAGE